MAKQYVYTSTLPIELKEDLEVYATRHKVSKNKVIEKALKKFLMEERKKTYAETFKKANNDPEMISMADWGLDDYLQQLKQLEK
ncbi:MAG: CopG family transcriptional regulator [Bacteroidota bacterium]